MTSKTKVRGTITYDDYFGHVCTCADVTPDDSEYPVYERTVDVVRSVEPTETGSWFYACSRCGASGWSGL